MQKNTDRSSFVEKASRKAKMGIALSACSLLLAGALFGCAGQPQTLDSEEQTISASEYMVKLNQAADSLHESMDGFAAAVSAGDITTLQSKSDAAFQAMEELQEYKTPEELTDVRNKYEEAITTLHNALNEYIVVYTEIQNEKDQSKINIQKYAQRFENIQKAYDNGMNLLEQADAAAKEL